MINCNLNLTLMTQNLKNQASMKELTQLQRVTENHKDPQVVFYCPPHSEKTQQDLYQFQAHQGKNSLNHFNNARSLRQEERLNIQLTILLVNQNDEIVEKIQQIKKLMNEEELKSKIFLKKIETNQKNIQNLFAQKQKLKEQHKIKSLNESFIPNKSVELNTTANTNAWLNQFFSKSQIQNLWSTKDKQKGKERKLIESKIKNYTIDLSSFMNTARIKNQKAAEKSSELKHIEQKLKTKSTIKSNTNRTSHPSKNSNKVQLHQKQTLLNKNITQMRNLKKNKFNPQL